MNIFQWNFIWNSNIFIQENAFEHVVSEMVAILTQKDHIWLPPISWHIIREGASRSAYNASKIQILNTLRLRRNVRLFTGGLYKCIFLNENLGLSIKISLKFVPEGSVNNVSSFIHIMAWHRSGDKPLSETMIVELLTYICVTIYKSIPARRKSKITID